MKNLIHSCKKDIINSLQTPIFHHQAGWPAIGDIDGMVGGFTLYSLFVQWINYGQHTPDKVPIVVVVIDRFGFKTLHGPVDH